MSGNGRCPLPHRPELRHFENGVVFSDAVRAVQRRPFGCLFDNQGKKNHGKGRRRRNDNNRELSPLFCPCFLFLTLFSDTVYYRAGIENHAHRGYH